MAKDLDLEVIPFEDVLQQAMKNPEFKEEFDELQVQRELAQLLKQARLDKNLTQAQVAEISGINVKNISRLERGIVSPKYATVVRYLKALGGSFKYVPHLG
ncbi:helix-turn-helix transcriptional regulator [Mannheimia sp. AT1]|uniref:Helix-turn-helix transcriptional regulator n=1 Tax=Mannheimia cairinae TaxID=3025936 RepID=A0ABT5MSV9_9PAST|nr:helix-turn-helix transcriptional regulator [Mannheimia cairinae]MDD0823913.1 helix-turn-helix transcriptional regulator [Mannheimia cairinae]MDD0825229.1 helix-turn-helix transcriptional regulator [Mannheimia cairinae]